MKSTYTEAHLIGRWQTPDPDNGYKATITITFTPDHVLHYVFENQYSKSEIQNTWAYSRNILTEYSEYGTWQGAIQWLTDDYFVLTIIENGEPAYKGRKRYYQRLPEPKK